MKYTFQPQYKYVTAIPGIRSVEEIANEPMLFSANWKFAYTNGGPLTKEILTLLYDVIPMRLNGHNLVIDTRSHMLMPGMYPAIPGWHCDFAPRPDGQPNFNEDEPLARSHWAIFLATEENVSRTQYIIEPITVEYDKDHVWQSVDRYLQPLTMKIIPVKEGEVVRFGGATLHRAVECQHKGWRWFFRASQILDEPKNQIRKQTQVYLDINEAGW